MYNQSKCKDCIRARAFSLRDCSFSVVESAGFVGWALFWVWFELWLLLVVARANLAAVLLQFENYRYFFLR